MDLLWKTKDCFDNIKRYFQRAKRGYDYVDRYNLNIAVSRLIDNIIDEMIDGDNHGYPVILDNIEQWNDILRKIQKGFHMYHKECGVLTEEEKSQLTESLELFSKYFENLWD